jgi:hypothetical protein
VIINWSRTFSLKTNKKKKCQLYVQIFVWLAYALMWPDKPPQAQPLSWVANDPFGGKGVVSQPYQFVEGPQVIKDSCDNP